MSLLGPIMALKLNEACAGELTLWTHVMMQAIEDAKRGRRPAINWIKSPSGDVGSFRWICGLTGVELDFAREQALSQRTQRRARQKRVR